MSKPGAHFMSIDLANFYLMTPLKRPEFAKIKLSNIPEEIRHEYKLHKKQYPMDGYTSNAPVECTVYLKLAALVTTFLKNASTMPDTTKAPLSRVNGNTPLNQSNSPWLSTILGSSTPRVTMPTTSSTPSKNIMMSLLITPAGNMSRLTLTGTTIKAKSTFPWPHFAKKPSNILNCPPCP
ncbi:hypothetical protein ACHAW6_005339 [Cyclotella cf. meneghiniana]